MRYDDLLSIVFLFARMFALDCHASFCELPINDADFWVLIDLPYQYHNMWILRVLWKYEWISCVLWKYMHLCTFHNVICTGIIFINYLLVLLWMNGLLLFPLRYFIHVQKCLGLYSDNCQYSADSYCSHSDTSSVVIFIFVSLSFSIRLV